MDTGILIHYIWKSALYQQIEADHQLTANDAIPLISVVTKGELLSFSIQRNWGAQKRTDLNQLLNKLPIIDIHSQDAQLLNAYADLDSFSKGKLVSKPLGKSSIKMGKNDLWIAATAVVANAILITTDGDFDHLNQTFLTVSKY